MYICTNIVYIEHSNVYLSSVSRNPVKRNATPFALTNTNIIGKKGKEEEVAMPWYDTKQFLTCFGALYFLRVLSQFFQVTIFAENTLKQLSTIGPVPLTQPLDVIKCKVQTLAF